MTDTNCTTQNAGWTARIQAAMLILMGLAAGWFAFSDSYSLLMNPKFQWLTLAGSLLVLAMGLSAFIHASKTSLSGMLSFILLGAIILLGKPLTASSDSFLTEQQLDAGAAFIADENYPMTDMRQIKAVIREPKNTADGMKVSVLGTLRSIPQNNGGEQLGIMRSYMVCCVADAYAFGLRLDQAADVGDLNVGDWIVVKGTVSKLAKAEPVPAFRMGTVSFPVVSDSYIMEPTQIAPYTATLPLLTERLTSEKASEFAESLQRAGLWETLQGKGPYTVFIPVNETFENAPASKSELKDNLSFYIVPGRYTDKDLYDQTTLKTIHNRQLNIRVDNGKLYIEDSRFLFKNIIARNGIMHMIYPALNSPE